MEKTISPIHFLSRIVPGGICDESSAICGINAHLFIPLEKKNPKSEVLLQE